MFFNQRILQAEYFDEPDRPDCELAEGYRMLARINRLFVLGEPYKRFLPATLGDERCRNLTLLDLGGGDGAFGDELSRWASSRGWNWQFTTLDLNIRAMRLHPPGRFVAGSALALPFRDEAFDVVVSSQMAHHLGSEEEVCRHFREAWRVSRHLLFLNDVHRNVLLYTLLWLVLRVQSYPKHFLSDALISVRRGWRVNEWRSFAHRAEIPNARVSLYAGARVILQARKPVPPASPTLRPIPGSANIAAEV